MKTFEERRAEIFRRGEQRIKERKTTRRRILLACVPLIVCASVLIARPFGDLYGSNSGADSMPNSGADMGRYGIEVWCGDDHRVYTDEATVTAVSELLAAITEQKDETTTATNNDDSGNDSAASERYTIMLVDEHEQVATYVWQDMVLIDADGISYRVSATQRAALIEWLKVAKKGGGTE